MDLREYHRDVSLRHPWEVSRAWILRKILARRGLLHGQAGKVLDIGCGDGYTAQHIFRGSNYIIDGIDTNLQDGQIAEFSSFQERMKFYNDYSAIKGKQYDLVLMLDVIEHIRDAHAFVADIAEKYSTSNTVFLVTVPGFQCLFSGHDKALGHLRRYNRSNLVQVLEQADIVVQQSGYLYASLIPVRLLAILREIFGPAKQADYFGLGAWHGGKGLTSALTTIMNLENRFLLFCCQLGLYVPGLSVWAIGQKQSS